MTAAPDSGSTFLGWSGPCTGTATCKLTLGASTTATATFESGTAGINSLNHIIFFAQENRSLDNYFGAMRKYWKDNGIPDQSFDGLPQFNPTSGAAPLFGPPPAIPGCDPTSPYPGKCIFDTSHTVASFHMISVCNENTSPSWQEAHNDWDYTDPVGTRPAKNNGFVHTAAGDARDNNGHPFYDTDGIRAMGYWDGTDLNYDYFMATKFATSDRFFHPVMSRTQINREYLDGGTSGGYALPIGSNAKDEAKLKTKPIFEELQNAGISWKVYINPKGTGCAGPPYQASCLIKTVSLNSFTYAATILANYPQKIALISDYFNDLKNGTLPQVSEIYAASDAGLDEHGSDSDSSADKCPEGSAVYRLNHQRTHAKYFVARFGVFLYLRRERRSVRSRGAATDAQSRWYQAGRFTCGLHLYREDGSDMRFHIYRLSHTLDCHFPICQEELRLPHGHGLHGHPEVHRNAVQSTCPHQAGCGSALHDGVLQFQQSAVDESARTSSTKREQPVLPEQTAVEPIKRFTANSVTCRPMPSCLDGQA